MSTLTPALVYQHLSKVIDPELGIDIVKLGLVYEVKLQPTSAVGPSTAATLNSPKLKIRMTLTTPGCPLAGVFDQMVRDALFGLPGLDVDRDVAIELTFDPPWVPDMMDAEARAELGFD